MYKKNILKKGMTIALSILLILGTSGFSSKSSNLTKSTSKELTISVLHRDRYLDLAIEKFNKVHPEVKVIVKESSTSPNPGGKNMVIIRDHEDPKDVEKYVNDVSTELMSGKGSDIIALNNLPYQKYVEKHLLANLTGLMSSDKTWNKNNYYTNILDAMKTKGSLYALPLSVSIDVIVADKTALNSSSVKINDNLWTWDDFRKAAENVISYNKKKGTQDMYALAGMDESRLLSTLVQSSYSKFVDAANRKVNFNSKDFINLLKQCKYMLDNKLVDIDTSQGKLMDLAVRGKTVFNALTLNTYMDFSIAKMSYDNPIYLKSPSQGNGTSFSSKTLYGINNNSNNKVLAYEFIKVLLSDDVQSDMSLIGASVNKAAAKKRADNILMKNSNGKGGGRLMIGSKDSSQTIDMKPLTQVDINTMDSLVGKASKYTEIDQNIINIIQEESQSFLTGQKSAEEIAKTIQGRTNIYINE